MSIILGIDPGSRLTGFAILKKVEKSAEKKAKETAHNPDFEVLVCGVIDLKSHDTFPGRMRELGLSLRDLFEAYKPNSVVIEKIFLGKNADSAFKLGHARGVVMYEAAVFGCQIFEYATRLVKKGIAGHGGAGKDEVKAMVEKFLRLKKPLKSIDASDALAMALYHGFYHKDGQ